MFSVFIMLIVGVAGVFNYCTAYEYSYNGRTLGLVKEKDDVLRITDLVQGALTKDKNVDVVIDPASDITFKRVSALGDVEIDSSEEVLKRLSYMGNLNVKAYGIYINGEKVGSVENKKTAANVLQDIKDRYTRPGLSASISSSSTEYLFAISASVSPATTLCIVSFSPLVQSLSTISFSESTSSSSVLVCFASTFSIKTASSILAPSRLLVYLSFISWNTRTTAERSGS